MKISLIVFVVEGEDDVDFLVALSVVVEVPKALLGSATTLNTWVEAKRKI